MSKRTNGGRVTIKDVARAANVSVTTASEALNRKPRVAQATRKKVEQVAKELGYSASRSARNLHAGRTGALALIVAPLQLGNQEDSRQAVWDIDFYIQILNGASARAFERGYLLSMVPFEASTLQFLDAVDGAIVVDPSPDEDLLVQAKINNRHCVTVGRNTHSLSWVDNDFQSATRSALEHLTQTEESRPMFFLTETTSLYVRDELSAYLDWCFERNIEPVIHRAAGHEVDDAEPVIEEALSRPERPFDSVLTTLDTLALATARVAARLGLEVPDDLQIFSLADSRYLEMSSPVSITALDLQPARLGALAVDVMVEEIEKGSAQDYVLVESYLSIRDSTLGSK